MFKYIRKIIYIQIRKNLVIIMKKNLSLMIIILDVVFIICLFAFSIIPFINAVDPGIEWMFQTLFNIVLVIFLVILVLVILYLLRESERASKSVNSQ